MGLARIYCHSNLSINHPAITHVVSALLRSVPCLVGGFVYGICVLYHCVLWDWDPMLNDPKGKVSVIRVGLVSHNRVL